MQRFKNVLVVVDDVESSRQAVAAASELCRRNDAKLTLIGLVEMSMANRVLALSDGTDVDIAELLAAERRGELEDLVAELRLDAVDIDVVAGGGFVEVVQRIQRHDHDIVMCGVASGPSSGLVGSSLVMHLLRKSPVPVWVETPRGDASPDVAVALGPFGIEYQKLNHQLIELAGSLAAIRVGTLHLLHAWRLEGETLLRGGRVRLPAHQVDELAQAAHLEANANMKRLSEQAQKFGIPCVVHVERGRPTDVLRETDIELRPGVLVLGTLARAGLPGMFMGNTAEQVLGVVDASVLAVKPEGFVSPIAQD